MTSPGNLQEVARLNGNGLLNEGNRVPSSTSREGLPLVQSLLS